MDHLVPNVPFFMNFYGNKKKVNSTFGFEKRTFINVQNGNPERPFAKRFWKSDL
jgi:hypothetical protein